MDYEGNMENACYATNNNTPLQKNHKSESCAKIVKLPIKKLLVLKKKGQNTTKISQSCEEIVKLPIQKILVFFFARQGSGPYQIPSSSSFDMDLIILVLRKKNILMTFFF
jgi:hypothetical protein